MNGNAVFSYKLGRYMITQDANGGLWWESHHGLSGAQAGKCVIEGNILVIGPTETEKQGFLKKEFIEYLNRLPLWKKTRYYCLSHSIYQCKSGGRISFSKKANEQIEVPLGTIDHRVTNDDINSRKIINKEQDIETVFLYIKEKMNTVLKLLKK